MNGLFPGVCFVGLAAACGALPRSAAAQQTPRPAGAARNFDVEYAQAKLELAEANLKRAEGMNQRVSNAVSANVVSEYQHDVSVAQSRLDAAQAGKPHEFAVWLRAAETNAEAAKTAWNSAVAANKRTPGTVEATDVERLRLRAEVLRLNFERGQSLADQSREVQLEWRVSSLGDEVERLSEVVLRAAPSRPGYPQVWYYYAH